MAHVLILGGTSWLGGEIAKAAVAREDTVTCLARGESGHVPAGATFLGADRGGRDPYRDLSDTRWDYVFDVSWQPAHVRGAVEALGHISSHWTYVSSVSAYADQSVGGDEDADVHQPLVPDEADEADYGPAKVACERIVQGLPHTLIARAGLLGGPGDRSDRFGYWVSRFALAGDQPVLVPDAPDQPIQVLDARDLAVWLIKAAAKRTTGAFNAVGERARLGEVIDAAAAVAGFTGHQVKAASDWLDAKGVSPWSGPSSLPLWAPGHDGLGSRSDVRAVEAGLQRRPLSRMLEETLEYEHTLGLDRERRAGLTRDEELGLIRALEPLSSGASVRPLGQGN